MQVRLQPTKGKQQDTSRKCQEEDNDKAKTRTRQRQSTDKDKTRQDKTRQDKTQETGNNVIKYNIQRTGRETQKKTKTHP